jgi:hypothetical protein
MSGASNKSSSFFFECLFAQKRERGIIHWRMMKT